MNLIGHLFLLAVPVWIGAATAQAQIAPGGPEGTVAGPATSVIDGLVETTADDPAWVLAVSDNILRRNLCIASFPCDPTIWYERVELPPCYSVTRYFRLAPGVTTATAFPMSGLLEFGVDGLYVRSGTSFQLFRGVDESDPLTVNLSGDRFVSIDLWEGLACDGFEPGTLLVEGDSPGALGAASIVLGPGSSPDLDCGEFDRYESLTPNDSLTVLTNSHNPGLQQGYLYVTAVDIQSQPVGFDHLIGSLMVVDGLRSAEFSVNAVDYRSMVPEGVATDVDGDGHVDLNGIEYEKTAGEILIPRFIGQNAQISSELILIAMSGGRKFDTSLDFLIYNDNEAVFSAQHTFRCWDRVRLTDISEAFADSFLSTSSGDDPSESLRGRESGWMRIQGGEAFSTAASVSDPAFYAVYVERVAGTAAADLPMETCLQTGHFLSNSVLGDNGEASLMPEDCSVSIGRRQPGSFLLIPEFDNRVGVVSLVTVTNVNRLASTRVHFSYIGRFGN